MIDNHVGIDAQDIHTNNDHGIDANGVSNKRYAPYTKRHWHHSKKKTIHQYAKSKMTVRYWSEKKRQSCMSSYHSIGKLIELNRWRIISSYFRMKSKNLIEKSGTIEKRGKVA